MLQQYACRFIRCKRPLNFNAVWTPSRTVSFTVRADDKYTSKYRDFARRKLLYVELYYLFISQCGSLLKYFKARRLLIINTRKIRSKVVAHRVPFLHGLISITV